MRASVLQWALDPALLGDRMSFIAGPRQVGKTTMLRNYLKEEGLVGRYHNWDTPTVRAAFRRDPEFFMEGVSSRALEPVVFDELHKIPKWKSHLKGMFDAWQGRVRFIVTGSARLDFMRKSGDSLLGRYFLFRKLPLHPRECIDVTTFVDWFPGDSPRVAPTSSAAWLAASRQLFETSGFPEPFLSGSQRFLNRWRVDHLSLLVTEDLSELTKIEQVLRVEELAELLRARTGSPLSTNRLAQDLGAGFPTVKRWLDALELVYLTFRIPPYATKLARAVRKEPKLYFWDWSLVESEGARFENMVAVHLMRAISSWNERGFGPYDLHYVRTKDGDEVDFLITEKRKPKLLIEAKQTDEHVSSSFFRLRAKLGVQSALWVVQKPGVLRQHREEGVWTMSIDRLLQLLP
jgi:predicted AAA+ superfamily ATPase